MAKKREDLSTNVNESDKKIIEELMKNSRRSTRELAKELRMHPSSVATRIKKLEQLGIIRGYGVDLDFEKLGYEHIGIIEITMEHGALLVIQEKIAKMPEVIGVFDVTGQSDSIIIAMAKSRQQFSSLVKEILGMKNIVRTNTHIVLNLVKLGARGLP